LHIKQSLTTFLTHSSIPTIPAYEKIDLLTLLFVGQQGDYTWRYRIWQFFQDNGIDVQMVGPYTGTVRIAPY
jgi:hypothetical protein